MKKRLCWFASGKDGGMYMIDPNEAPEGYLAVKGNNGCFECAFKNRSADCLSADCTPNNRKDLCHVIFVKKPDDGRATANFPCDDMGTPV